MLKTRLLLLAGSAIVIFLLFQLPKSVVENEPNATTSADTVRSHIESHAGAPSALIAGQIRDLRAKLGQSTEKEKNAIFADSLADLYRLSNRFDSAAWFAGESARYFNRSESWVKAGDLYYQAYSIEADPERQKDLAAKARDHYQRVLNGEPNNLEVRTKMAMTFMATANPMQGIRMLREVLEEDPRNVPALYNMGMLSIQSGQSERAANYLTKLVEIDPSHIQGQLLLGIALMNLGRNEEARVQFGKVKSMDKDPAVQATVDSYLKDIK